MEDTVTGTAAEPAGMGERAAAAVMGTVLAVTALAVIMGLVVAAVVLAAALALAAVLAMAAMAGLRAVLGAAGEVISFIPAFRDRPAAGNDPARRVRREGHARIILHDGGLQRPVRAEVRTGTPASPDRDDETAQRDR